MYKNKIGIDNLKWLMYHKTKPNQRKEIREPKHFKGSGVLAAK